MVNVKLINELLVYRGKKAEKRATKPWSNCINCGGIKGKNFLNKRDDMERFSVERINDTRYSYIPPGEDTRRAVDMCTCKQKALPSTSSQWGDYPDSSYSSMPYPTTPGVLPELPGIFNDLGPLHGSYPNEHTDMPQIQPPPTPHVQLPSPLQTQPPPPLQAQSPSTLPTQSPSPLPTQSPSPLPTQSPPLPMQPPVMQPPMYSPDISNMYQLVNAALNELNSTLIEKIDNIELDFNRKLAALQSQIERLDANSIHINDISSMETDTSNETETEDDMTSFFASPNTEWDNIPEV